ncbi:unnamed protein product [Trichogramma brassicae]|uniref:Integrase catalytic domain-containing protein n=1 Tax=Trichogramma brassicae TaxID=86971 RepID=A0A6H5ITW0_9HYME|nr:unnamed protein product [Trichogramma brassicae]
MGPKAHEIKLSTGSFSIGYQETPKKLWSKSMTRSWDGLFLQKDISEVWLTDSGASEHMTFRRNWFSSYSPRDDGSTVSLDDNKEHKIVGVGTVRIKRLVNDKWLDGRIENVLYVPGIRKNLLSVGAITRKGLKCSFEGATVTISSKNVVCARGILQRNNVYRMFIQVVVKSADDTQASVAASLMCWHERLGHVNARALKQLINKGLVKGAELNDNSAFFCHACQLGKSHELPFVKESEKKETKPGEFIHSDVCGPMPETSMGGARFFVTFMDDATGYRYIYFLKHKADVFDKFKEFERTIANKFGKPISTLRSDNGREYDNSKMLDYMKSKGIKFETSAPYTPQQNGKAERSNRTVIECARTMLLSSGLEQSLWAEAVNCAVYLLNRVTMSSCQSGVTAFEAWTGHKPNIEHAKAFGSTCYIHVPKQFTTKFDARAKEGILVGYERESRNFRVYDPKNRKVQVSRHVVFSYNRDDSDDDLIFSNVQKETTAVSPKDHSDPEDEAVSTERQETVAPSKSKSPVRKEYLDHGGRKLRDRSLIKAPMRFQANVAEVHVPSTYAEATTGSNASLWTQAIKEELDAHKENETWTFVPRNSAKQPIKSKWVFKVINNADDNSTRLKARLCTKGFLQKEGIDYLETFAPVVRYDSLRVLLSLVARENLEMVTFDVRTAFLYGHLKEEILHMEIPEGVVGESIDAAVEENSSRVLNDHVCLLNKSLYGLKQSPRCWNQRFKDFLSKFDFCESTRSLDEQRLVEHLNARSSPELFEASHRRAILCNAGLRPYSRKARASRPFCKAFPVT